MVRPYTVDVEMSVRFCQATFVNMGVWCNSSTLHFYEVSLGSNPDTPTLSTYSNFYFRFDC